jgi:heme exporter protein B
LTRLVAREARLEWRTRETTLPLALLAALVVTVGLLAFHEESGRPETMAAVLWSALALAASVGNARSFVAESDRRTLDNLLTLPVERSTLYLAKAATSAALTLAVGAAALLAQVAVGATVPASAWPGVAAILLLGAVGLAATTTMVGALSAQARTRDLLLPVLALPLVLPLLISCVHGTLHALDGSSYLPEALVLAGYDLAFLGVSALLTDEVLAA